MQRVHPVWSCTDGILREHIEHTSRHYLQAESYFFFPAPPFPCLHLLRLPFLPSAASFLRLRRHCTRSRPTITLSFSFQMHDLYTPSSPTPSLLSSSSSSYLHSTPPFSTTLHTSAPHHDPRLDLTSHTPIQNNRCAVETRMNLTCSNSRLTRPANQRKFARRLDLTKSELCFTFCSTA